MTSDIWSQSTQLLLIPINKVVKAHIQKPAGIYSFLLCYAYPACAPGDLEANKGQERSTIPKKGG